MSFILFGAIIMVAVAYIAALGVRIGPPSHRTNLSMTVADANSLVVGSNVLLRGVPVGKVSGIASSLEGATIDFYIDDRFQVPVDSDVRLDNLSALGESYIGLVPRSQGGPTLRNGQRIATESVIQPPSISELAKTVVRVINQADPAALERIVGEADNALPDPNLVLPNLAHASKLLRSTAADMHGRGRQVIDNFQTLLQNAFWLGPVIADITASIPELGRVTQQLYVGSINDVWAGSPETVRQEGKYLARIQKFLDDRGPDLKVLSEAALPRVHGIAGALMNFDPSQILGNILASVPDDGLITLHVAMPGR